MMGVRSMAVLLWGHVEYRTDAGTITCATPVAAEFFVVKHFNLQHFRARQRCLEGPGQGLGREKRHSGACH